LALDPLQSSAVDVSNGYIDTVRPGALHGKYLTRRPRVSPAVRGGSVPIM